MLLFLYFLKVVVFFISFCAPNGRFCRLHNDPYINAFHIPAPSHNPPTRPMQAWSFSSLKFTLQSSKDRISRALEKKRRKNIKRERKNKTITKAENEQKKEVLCMAPMPSARIKCNRLLQRAA
jgi:hypothetical protein